jgi:hypothetical protein
MPKIKQKQAYHKLVQQNTNVISHTHICKQKDSSSSMKKTQSYIGPTHTATKQLTF